MLRDSEDSEYFGEIDLEDLKESRSLKLPVDRSFPALFSRSNEDGASIKIHSSIEARSRIYWFTGKDITVYVIRQQTLDRLRLQKNKPRRR